MVEVNAIAAVLSGKADAALHEVGDGRVGDVYVVLLDVIAGHISKASAEVLVVRVIGVDGSSADMTNDDLIVGLRTSVSPPFQKRIWRVSVP